MARPSRAFVPARGAITPTSWKRSLAGEGAASSSSGSATAPNRRTIGPATATGFEGSRAFDGTGCVAAKIFSPQKAAHAATRAQMKKPVQRELMRRL